MLFSSVPNPLISVASMEEISLLSHFSPATRLAFRRQQRTHSQALNYEGVYYLIVLFSCTSPSLGEPEAERHLDVHLLQPMGWQVFWVQDKPKIKLGMWGVHAKLIRTLQPICLGQN